MPTNGLKDFIGTLTLQEQRAIAEGLTEGELAIFDILTKPRVDITAREQKQVKKVAKDLIQSLKAQKLVLDWRKRQANRAAVRLCIEEFLEKLPEAYTQPLYASKCEAVYQHVYDNYGGSGQSSYAQAAI